MAKQHKNLTAEERADLRDLEEQWNNFIDPFGVSTSSPDQKKSDKSDDVNTDNISEPYNPSQH